MVAKVQIKRTITPNQPPADLSLSPGELAIEMDTPTRLWVGVPPAQNPSGKKLLLDLSVSTLPIPIPPPAVGVGQVFGTYTSVGDGFIMLAGGTWFFWAHTYTSPGNAFGGNTMVDVCPGGAIACPGIAGNLWEVWMWRIA